ncbi:MAG TPA: RNA polymerase sigma factor [Kofleriaceae bacterium]|nr:RNA polymerase sigma factor [Kofleriaceae bacterium]
MHDDDGSAARELELAEATTEARDRLRGWMEAHGDAVYARCVKMLRDPVLAEDVMQRVFMEACRDYPKFRHTSSERTWLLGITTHRCKDAIKARNRLAQHVQSDDDALAEAADDAADLSTSIDLRRIRRWLADCLDELTEASRTALRLRFQAELSYEEMERELGDKPDTLRARVTRALPLLRRCLESKGWQGD